MQNENNNPLAPAKVAEKGTQAVQVVPAQAVAQEGGRLKRRKSRGKKSLYKKMRVKKSRGKKSLYKKMRVKKSRRKTNNKRR